MPDYWKVDRALLDRLCSSARLNLSEAEKNKFLGDMSDIMGAFKIIDEVDTTDVSPAYHPIELENIWREDKQRATKWNPLQNAAETEDSYIKGPKLV